MAIFGIAATFLLSSCSHFDNDQSHANKAFPAKIPLEKPSDRKLSAAMERMYDVWNPHEDRGNEFFSNFKYSRLKGFSNKPNVSRRDPSKVIRVDGTYYVYYTCRRTEGPPAGPNKATDTTISSSSRASTIFTTRLTARSSKVVTPAPSPSPRPTRPAVHFTRSAGPSFHPAVPTTGTVPAFTTHFH
jgi:hypothetical protein